MATIVLLLAFYLLHYLFASTTAHTTALLPAMLTIASTIRNEYGSVCPADGHLAGRDGDHHPYGTGPSPSTTAAATCRPKITGASAPSLAPSSAALLLIGYPWMSMMF